MGYQVKWIEDNLGISRAAIRYFEKEKLMPKHNGNGYREYTEEDLDRLWLIRVFQGMGFSAKQILKMGTDDLDFFDELEKKISDLEKQKDAIERNLGYARAIKLTGRFPSRPKKMGSIKWDDFYQKALDKWNIQSDPQLEEIEKATHFLLNPTDNQNELPSDDMTLLLQSMQEFMNNRYWFLMEEVLPKEILKRSNLGTSDPEVQCLIKILYDTRMASVPELQGLSTKQFARYESSSYLYGDVAKIRENDYGKDGCQFIADALAVFGGYLNASDIPD